MPRSLSVGASYFVLAEKIDGEFFLTSAPDFFLQKTDADSDTVKGPRGEFTTQEAGDLCAD
jgi:hypothetical protein